MNLDLGLTAETQSRREFSEVDSSLRLCVSAVRSKKPMKDLKEGTGNTE